MSHETWLIQYRAGSYRFGRTRWDSALTDIPPTDPTAVAPLLAAMTSAGYAGQPTMLAIPSPWCVSTSVVLASPFSGGPVGVGVAQPGNNSASAVMVHR